MAVYIIETPKELFWSRRKMETQWKHIDFLYKDRAKYKEMTEDAWQKYKSTTTKKLIELSEG